MSDDLPSKLDIVLLNEKFAEYKRAAAAAEEEEEEEDLLEGMEDVKETLMESDGDDEYDEDEAGDGDYEPTKPLLKPLIRLVYRLTRHWLVLTFTFTLLVLGCVLWASGPPSTRNIPTVSSFADISKSIQHLQWQINEANNRQKNKLQDLRNYLDLKMDEVHAKFTHVDNELVPLHKQQEDLVQRIDAISIGDVQLDMSKIPVILDDHNNVQLLPEFKRFLQSYIKSSLSSQEFQRHFQVNLQSFIEDYVKEIVSSKVGFMNKDEILQLVTLQFQQNKRKLIDEIKQLTQHKPMDDIIPSRLVDSKNDYTKQRKINFAQSANGARIINYLSSPTFRPRTNAPFSWWGFATSKGAPPSTEDEVSASSPFIVLTPNDGVWRSGDVNATLGIKFLEPIYISGFLYEHPRALNSALLTSCPKVLSLYVQVDDVASLRQHSDYDECLAGKYHKVLELEYDLNGDALQEAHVPRWLKRLLVKSMVVKVDGNYGNDFYTSVYKLHVQGLTRLDVLSVDTLMRNAEIGEPVKRGFRTAVQRFGDDN